MHDIADLEGRGLVGVFVASDVFIDAAEAQSLSLGVSPARLFVPHPIQDRTDDEMRTLAEDAVALLVARLTQTS